MSEGCKTVWVLLSRADDEPIGTYSSYRAAVAARLDAWKRHPSDYAIVPTELDKLIE